MHALDVRYWYGNPDRLSEGYYVQGGAPCLVLRFTNTRFVSRSSQAGHLFALLWLCGDP
jgi:hypothetical protein